MERSDKTYTLIGRDGKPYQGPTAGTLGGHRLLKGYGRLDCPSALRWIRRGHYVKHRVFFADEETAVAAGYRPCAVCMPAEYAVWKAGRAENPSVISRHGDRAEERIKRTSRRQQA